MAREMKDSGIEWIGEIPEEWEYTKLKFHYTFEKGKNAAMYTQDYIGQNKGNFPLYSGQTENEGIMGRINTFDYDVHECLFTTTVGAKVMTAKVLQGKFSLSQNCLIMKSSEEKNNKFFYYMLIPLFDFERSLIPTYMQPSLRISDLEIYSFFIPLPIEQQRIVDYLDEKCKEIDSIIENTKATIEEYKKYKYTVIADAVTMGLFTNVKSKNSGVDWIGSVPENWDIIKLKYLFSIKKEIANKLGYDILSVTQNGLKIKDISNNEGQISSDYSKYQIVEPNDFVMNHMDLLTGWVDCSVFYGVTSPDYRVFRLDDESKALREYFKYIFQLCYKHRIFYGLGQGVSNMGRWRLQTDKFINFEVPLPPIEEQKEIVEFLDAKCSEIDKLIYKKQQIVIELETYKKSLIYECVTGKVEV